MTSPRPAHDPTSGGWGPLGEYRTEVRDAATSGEAESVRRVVAGYRLWASTFDQVRTGLGELPIRGWEGETAEAAEQIVHTLRRKLSHAVDDLTKAAKDLDIYATALADALRQSTALGLLGSGALGETRSVEALGRQLTYLDEAGLKAARTVRDSAGVAPITSVFVSSDAPVVITTLTETTPTTPAAAPPVNPPVNPAPVTDTATGRSSPAVWTTSASLDHPALPRLPNAAHTDGWGPDDPRRIRWIYVLPPQGGRHDNLSRIAARELGDPTLWPVIYELNQGLPQPHGETLRNPDLIKPGWVLALPDDIPGVDVPSRVPPFGHSDDSCLPPPVPGDDPAVPVRTGPPEHTLSPTTGTAIGVALAAAILTVAVLAHRLKHPPGRRTSHSPDPTTSRGDQRHADIAWDEQSPTIRTLHTSLTQTHPDVLNPTPPEAPENPRPSPQSHAATVSGARPAPAAAQTTSPPAADPHDGWASLIPRDGSPHVNRLGHAHTRSRPPVEDSVDTHDPANRDNRTTRHADQADRQPGAAPHNARVAHAGLVRGLGIDEDGHTVVADLAALRGLGVHGAGALAAARLLLLDLLTPPTPQRPTPAAQVLVPRPDLAGLLDLDEDAPDHLDLPAGLRVAPDLASQLTELEVEILRRTREHSETRPPTSAHAQPPGWEPIVLIARATTPADPHNPTDSVHDPHRRLQAVLDLGATLGITAILLGPWPTGTSCHVNRHGRITGTAGPAGIAEKLNGVQMRTLSADTARELHDCLPRPDAPTASSSGLPTRLTPTEPGPASSTHNTNDSADANASHTATADETPPTPPLIADPASLRQPEPASPTNLAHHSTAPDPALPSRERPSVTEPLGVSTPTPATPSPTVPADALLVVLALGPLLVFARPYPGAPLQNITASLSKKQRLIIACLAAHTSPIPTDALLDMCWRTTASDKAAIARFHSAIYRLRNTLRDAAGHPDTDTHALISHSKDAYHFHPHTCWVDHHAFHTHLPPTHITDDAHATRLGEILNHYQGPLLQHLEYDTDVDWLADLRQNTRDTAITTAQRLAEHLAQTDPDQAAAHLSTALDHDPANDPTARQLIRHHLAHHQPEAAHRVYTELARHLAGLGLQPEPATTRLLYPPAA